MEETLLIYFIASILGICFTAWIFSIFFSIKDKIWYQRKHLNILVAIAKKIGVNEEEINDILITG